MHSTEILDSFKAMCQKINESESAEAWAAEQSKAVVFGTDEFEIDKANKRLRLKAGMDMDLAADESMFASEQEHGWLALMMESGRFGFILGSGDPFGEQAVEFMPTCAGFVKAAPASVAVEFMKNDPGPQSGNRAQRRAAEKEARRSKR